MNITVDEAIKPLVDHIALDPDPNLENQLLVKSRQPDILKYTPNDAKKRFGSHQMYQEWLAKGREIHWLVGPEDDLAGIIWYGPADFPLDLDLNQTPGETFAIRLYEGYAGHGLARPFMKLSLKAHLQQKQSHSKEIKGIWLQTDVDNQAALAVYTKFGYQEVARDAKRATLLLSKEQILAIAGVDEPA